MGLRGSVALTGAVVIALMSCSPGWAQAKRAKPAAAAPAGEGNRSIENAKQFLTTNEGLFSRGGWCSAAKSPCKGAIGPDIGSMKAPVAIIMDDTRCGMVVRFGQKFTRDGADTFYQSYVDWSKVVEIQKRELNDEEEQFLLLSRDGMITSLATASRTMVDRFASAFSYLKRNCAENSNLGF